MTTTYRTWRGRIRRSLEGCRPKLSIGLCLFEEEFSLDFFGYLITLPFLDRYHYEPYEMMEKWGVYYFERAIWFCWGSHSKALHMPWTLHHFKQEVQRPDGSWTPYVASYEVGEPVTDPAGKTHYIGGPPPDGRWEATYPYRYILRSGEVQDRLAKVYVERREWRQKWLYWCPYFALHRQSLEIEFNEEVGERSGSWKGGVVGCGYELLPKETPLECLRRMESERRFT